MKISKAIEALTKVLELKGDVEIENIASNLLKIKEKENTDVVLDFFKYVSNVIHDKKEILTSKMEINQIELDFWQKLIDISEESLIDKGDNSDEQTQHN